MNRALTANFRVEPADYRTDFQDLRRVREPVFVVEQQVPIELEWDALDPICQHVIARDIENQPIGTGRLTPQRKIGRMAVMREWRGRGVGEALLIALIDAARAQRWPDVILHAQVDAIGFYEKYGFIAFDAEFVEAGIRHQAMRLELQPVTERPPFKPRLDIVAVESLEDALRATAEVIAGSRRELCVFSRDLDYTLFAATTTMDALRAFATSSADTNVRVLLLDSLIPTQQNHPWLVLAQRLPSTFAFRACEEEHDRQYPSAFIVGDRGGLYFRPIGGRIEGEASNTSLARARQIIEIFNRMWEHARPCTEFRAIGI
ncbi:MAG: GNAT family N-acetyltransferase [Lysobacteraceae bacterium]